MEIVYDPQKTSFQKLLKLFFEIHDPSQEYGQGPDIGEQYLSAVFFLDMEQKQETKEIIGFLEQKGHAIATKLYPATTFWHAEDYHQDYYEKKAGKPYCHVRRRLFD